jgi:phosphatidylglycerol:prolipoprotein diacylglycerol transferase
MDPVLFQWGTLQLRSYAVLTELGAVLVFVHLYRHRRRLGLREPSHYWLLLNAILIGGFLGGRIGFLITDPPPPGAPWRPWALSLNSGFSAFGVIAGMALGIALCCRFLRYPVRLTLDRFFAVLPFWLATARVGCFLNGCCYGRPSTLPWAAACSNPGAALPRALLGVPLHPVQLYEAVADLLLGLALLRLAGRARPGLASALFLAGYGALRLALEPFRGDARPHPPEPLFALALIGAALALIAFQARTIAPRPS